MAHRYKLAFKTLSQLDIMSRIEGLLKSFHAYFKHSPKRHIEFVKMAELMETKGLELLKNVKTRWILLIEPLRCILQEDMFLLVKMKVGNNSKDKSAYVKCLPRFFFRCTIWFMSAGLEFVSTVCVLCWCCAGCPWFAVWSDVPPFPNYFLPKTRCIHLQLHRCNEGVQGAVV